MDRIKRINKKSRRKAQAEILAEAQALKAELEKEVTVVKFTEKVGPDGRTFGSITAKKIAEELAKQFGLKNQQTFYRIKSSNSCNWVLSKSLLSYIRK